MSNTIRIATVKATGSRYLVQRLVIASPRQPGRVMCWGEVVSFRGLATKHGESKVFTSEAVEVADVPKTITLITELSNQYLASLRAKGNIVTVSRTGRSYTNHGTAEQVEARAQSRASLAQLTAELSTFGFGRTRSGFQQPAVRKGEDKPVPEARTEIVERLVEQLTAKGAPAAVIQNYSNGEFISSSLIVGLTFEAVAKRDLEHECAGYTAHFDAALGLWWRTGGSSD